MENKFLALIQSWVQLSGILKNSRFTKELPYNEAVVMLQLYQAGDHPISIKEITAKTRMLKSQVNRTINSLETKGLLARCEANGDRRVGYVRAIKDKLDVFLQVHATSMDIAKNISQIIGPEDTDAFIRIVNKLALSGYHL
ncbi:MAG: MarR family transcriptional regulator [Oscillospiraceae bacterium]|nr:MarR family transcriptional regulator [Oscillospiraceae bacterium]